MRKLSICVSIISLIVFSSLFLYIPKTQASFLHHDPQYLWTKQIGGTGADWVLEDSSCMDSEGNLYLTGSFNGTVDFNPGPAIDSRTSAGGADIFLTKFNADDSYAWTYTMGSTDADGGGCISFDSQNNVYLIGIFNGTVDFDPSPATDNHSSNGVWDIFLTKFLRSGAYALTYTIGGTNYDGNPKLFIDRQDNIYYGGYFSSTVDFDPTGGIDNKTSAGGGYDVFLTKLNANLNYAWTYTWGAVATSSEYMMLGLSGDSLGNIYLGGGFRGTVDFDPTAGIDSHISTGVLDIDIIKINSDGTYGWGKSMGSSVGTDRVMYIEFDSANNMYLTGRFTGTVDFDPGAGVDNHTSGHATLPDVWLSKYSADGSYGWTKTFYGVDGEDEGRTIEIDVADNIYLTGYFVGTIDFDFSAGVDNHTAAGGGGTYGDMFFTKINADGTYGWTITLGASGVDDYGKSIIVTNTGYLYALGNFQTTVDFNFADDAQDNFTSNGGYDISISKWHIFDIVSDIVSAPLPQTGMDSRWLRLPLTINHF